MATRCIVTQIRRSLWQSALTSSQTNPDWHYQFLNGTSAVYIEELYNDWRKDPNSVHSSWDIFFKTQTQPSIPVKTKAESPTLTETKIDSKTPVEIQPLMPVEIKQQLPVPKELSREKFCSFPKITRVLSGFDEFSYFLEIIKEYQMGGHILAKLDPLNEWNMLKEEKQDTCNITEIQKWARQVQENIDTRKKQLVNILNQDMLIPNWTYVGGNEKCLTTGKVLEKLEHIYSGSVGVDISFLHDVEQSAWLRKELEKPEKKVSKQEKIVALKWLVKASVFESFLERKFLDATDYRLLGCENLIPLLNQIITSSSEFGVNNFTIAATHRGRSNILANVCETPMRHVFALYKKDITPTYGIGDLKENLGIEVHTQINKKPIRISLMASPTHTEQTHCVALGKTYGENMRCNDLQGKNHLLILIHGDAGMAGYGAAYETMNLCKLPMYSCNGVIHVILANQIGNTTIPEDFKSALHSSYLSFITNAPILHVNSDDTQAIIQVSKLASTFRSKYHKDIVLNVFGYRKAGHSTKNEPQITQPNLYQKICNAVPVLNKFACELVDENSIKSKDIDQLIQTYASECITEFQKSQKEQKLSVSFWNNSNREQSVIKYFEEPSTGISKDVIVDVLTKFGSLPPDSEFVVHNGTKRLLKGRMELLKQNQIDWAMAEAAAIGSLLIDDVHVRLSGQDVVRGTFSHRHHAIHHQKEDTPQYYPLSNLNSQQAIYSVTNSSLSENGILGFEYGYSLSNPNALVLFEAQYGDFINTAQPIIDEFIASGEAKWGNSSGIVLLLPHGLEGQGPEHSNCHVERFLQLCNEDSDIVPKVSESFRMDQLHNTNLIVTNCSNAAQYFHVLRRQILLPFRKPLVIYSPKFLLRYVPARSSINEIVEGTTFQQIIPERGPACQKPDTVAKLIFCTGKIYYVIIEEREKSKLENEIAVCRIEQLVPFPWDLVKEELNKYKNACKFWVQEEHRNTGYWAHIEPRFMALGENNLMYIGRKSSGSPATGYKHQHKIELEEMMKVIIKI